MTPSCSWTRSACASVSRRRCSEAGVSGVSACPDRACSTAPGRPGSRRVWRSAASQRSSRRSSLPAGVAGELRGDRLDRLRDLEAREAAPATWARSASGSDTAAVGRHDVARRRPRPTAGSGRPWTPASATAGMGEQGGLDLGSGRRSLPPLTIVSDLARRGSIRRPCASSAPQPPVCSQPSSRGRVRCDVRAGDEDLAVGGDLDAADRGAARPAVSGVADLAASVATCRARLR